MELEKYIETICNNTLHELDNLTRQDRNCGLSDYETGRQDVLREMRNLLLDPIGGQGIVIAKSELIKEGKI